MTDLRDCTCGRGIEVRCNADVTPGTTEFRAFGDADAITDCPTCGRNLDTLLAIGALKPHINGARR